MKIVKEYITKDEIPEAVLILRTDGNSNWYEVGNIYTVDFGLTCLNIKQRGGPVQHVHHKLYNTICVSHCELLYKGWDKPKDINIHGVI